MLSNYEANYEAKTGQSFTNHQFCGSTANSNLQSSNGALEAYEEMHEENSRPRNKLRGGLTQKKKAKGECGKHEQRI